MNTWQYSQQHPTMGRNSLKYTRGRWLTINSWNHWGGANNHTSQRTKKTRSEMNTDTRRQNKTGNHWHNTKPWQQQHKTSNHDRINTIRMQILFQHRDILKAEILQLKVWPLFHFSYFKTNQFIDIGTHNSYLYSQMQELFDSKSHPQIGHKLSKQTNHMKCASKVLGH